MNQPKKTLLFTHDCDPITEVDADMLGKLMEGVCICQRALSFNRVIPSVPEGLERLLTGEMRERIASEVSGCKRMIAYITYTNLGVQAEIQFKQEKAVVREIAICFAHQAWRFEVLWGL